MAISGKNVASSSTLNELRTQFNNLVTDVTAIEGGTISFTALNTTTTNTTTLNVKEDGTIIFEGATDDAFETTLTVVDPTADRTVTIPNETGTVHTSGGTTTHTAIVIADGGNIGSASDTNAIGISSGGVVSVTATTANTSATDGALTVAGGLGVAADASIGDDLRLISDSAVLSFGADSDTTLTHTDGSGLTLNSTNKLMFNDASQFIQGVSATVLDIAATDEIELTATLIDVVGNLAASGTYTGGGLMTTGGNIVIPNAGNIGSVGDTDAIAIASGGGVTLSQTLSGAAGTFSGILKTDDTTEATSTTDGSLQTDGGLSVAKDVVAGDDVKLLSDSAVLAFGADGDVTITHVADTGLLLNGTSQLQFNDASQNITAPSGTVLDINATDEVELNATLVDVNANLDVSGTYTGGGLMTTGGNIVIPDAGTIGSASDTDAISISSGGVVNVSATTANTSASDGALTVAGGLGVAADASIGDDLRLISDSAVLSFGADSEVTLTHVADTGLTLTHTASGDDKPIVLQLKSEEDAIVADEVIASLEFAAGDSDGTDGATVAAGIHAIAEGAFSASANATKLAFTTGVSETAAASATAKMTLSSAGLLTIADDFMIKDGGTIGVASANDAMTISSAGIVTFKDDILIKDGGTIGSASAASAMTIASTGIVTFVDDIIIKDGGTIGAASATGAITISSGGIVTLVDDLIIKDGGTIGSASDADAIAIGSDGDVTLTQDLELQHDGAILSFGANDEITLTHVHDTGLLLEDSGGTPTLQFHDANESVSSDGGHLIFTSNGVAFDFPSADGSNGQVLKTNGGGVLSFTDVTASSLAADDLAAGDAAVTISTSSGNITIDAAANDSDIIFKGTDGSSDTTFLTIDGSDAGTLIANHNLELGTDASEILFGADNEIKMIHVADTGLNLKHTATTDDTPFVLTLQTGDTDIAANDVIGKLAFQAPDEGTGTDAILVAAAIQAVSEGDFAADANATRLEFMTGASEAATSKMTLSSGGVLDVDGGITVDNITIDGTEIDLSSGDLTLDVEGDIILDANGADIKFNDDGTAIAEFTNSSTDFVIKSVTGDKDIIFKGVDGTSAITALTLDMSEAGAATFNNDVTAFSDERLKTEVETINDALNKVCQMRGVSFKRTDNDGRTSVGVIAQEIEKVLPEVVREDSSEDKIKSVAYGNIVGVLIEAIKELKNEIEELKKE